MTEPGPGVDAWTEQTSAFDRVQSIASTLSEPRPASYIADEAYVAENTARNHLQRLVDLNVLRTIDREGTTLYAPDPLHTRMQTLRELLDEYDQDALLDLKADIQSRIEEWRDAYDVVSPSALRERAARTDTASETREIKQTARDWELLAYRLSIVEDAIENYATYTQDFEASA